MRLAKTRRSHGVLFDITPMIDVVFQLIIFFMTCSQATTSPEPEPVELPNLVGTADKQDRHLTISVTADDRIFIDGSAATIADLEGRARSAIERAGGPNAVIVGLRVDRRARSGAVNQIVAALKKAGVPRGRIAVEATGGIAGQAGQ